MKSEESMGIQRTPVVVFLLAGLLVMLLGPTPAWSQQPTGSLYFLNRAKSSEAAGYFDRYGYFHQTLNQFRGSVFLGVTHMASTTNGTLAYNATTGVGTVVQVKDDGFVTENTYLFSPGWSFIVGVGDYLFFYNSDGSAAVGQITADGEFKSGLTYSPATFGQWTHIVATNNNLFFYNYADGSAATGFIDHGAFVSTQALSAGSLPIDFSYVVGNDNFLLLYNQQTGASLIGVIDGRPGVFISRATATLPAGCSKLVKHNRYVLLYNTNTGAGTIGYFDRVSAAKFVVTQQPAFSPNWTSIVSTNDDLLFYNTVTGSGAAGQIDSNGKFKQTPQALTFSPGWFGVVATTR